MAITIKTQDTNSIGTMKLISMRVQFASVTSGAITFDLKTIRALIVSDETTATPPTWSISGAVATFAGVTSNDYLNIIAIGQ
jgi:hypothetical protein